MWCNLQSSDGEDGDESDFLTAPKVQASDDRYGQNNKREVRDNVDACVGAVQPVSICDLSTAAGSTDNHIANWLMHVADSLVQKARTGTQANMLLNTVQIV
jgi:hypothetical protein